MARPSSISNEQILKAAREIFLERGPGATTHEIAARAGISEGTIFRRYESKDALMIAAMSPPTKIPWISLAEEIAGHGDARDNLLRLSREVLAFYRELLPCMTFMLSCHISPIEFCKQMDEPPPAQALGAMLRFFVAEQARGALQTKNPEISARMLLAALHHYAFFSAHGFDAHHPIDADAYIEGVVDQLMRP